MVRKPVIRYGSGSKVLNIESFRERLPQSRDDEVLDEHKKLTISRLLEAWEGRDADED